jgi:hypothetical protein
MGLNFVEPDQPPTLIVTFVPAALAALTRAGNPYSTSSVIVLVILTIT